MSKVIVALDYNNEKEALEFVDKVTPSLCKLKVGKSMFTRLGPKFVKRLVQYGFDVFLDLKFHDIPEQVAGACSAAADLGVWMVNVHALGGLTMMKKAKAAIAGHGHSTLIIAVTLLTSFGSKELIEVGVNAPLEEEVLKLANLAKEADLNGVVCSAKEASLLKRQLGSDFLLVTPGIRPEFYKQDDQTRVVTPQKAIKNGSDYIVIGRPITKAENPFESLMDIVKSIN